MCNWNWKRVDSAADYLRVNVFLLSISPDLWIIYKRSVPFPDRSADHNWNRWHALQSPCGCNWFVIVWIFQLDSIWIDVNDLYRLFTWVIEYGCICISLCVHYPLDAFYDRIYACVGGDNDLPSLLLHSLTHSLSSSLSLFIFVYSLIFCTMLSINCVMHNNSYI